MNQQLQSISPSQWYKLAAIGVVIIVIVGIVLAHMSQVRSRTNQNTCVDNQKQIMQAVSIFVQENEGVLPGVQGIRTSWRDHGEASVIHVPDAVFHCHAVSAAQPSFDYGYNDSLMGAKVATVTQPDTMVLIADSDEGLTLKSPADIAWRHGGKCVVSFVDGHVQEVAAGATLRLQ